MAPANRFRIMAGGPTDDELIAFAAELLGPDRPISEPEGLRETVRDARELWILLYETHHNPPAD